MAVVIRLQGLNVTAGSQDVRKFFTGLTIPDGGVHIIGGEREEAFIIFASDEDARRAMTRSGGLIRGSSITLLLSSKTEMQNVLDMSMKQVEMDRKWPALENSQRRAFEDDPGHLGPLGHGGPLRDQRDRKADDHLFLFLKGLPFSVTEADIFDFFGGLAVDDVILLKKPNGQNNGHGLVKFAAAQDAAEGLKRDKGYIGARYVEISPTTEKDWLWNTGRRQRMARNSGGMEEHGAHFDGSSDFQYRDRSPQRPLSSSKEYCVLLENLSHDVEKNDLKRLFWSASIEDDQVLFLVGDDGRRTRSAFVLFRTHQDYLDALAKDGAALLDRWVSVQHTSREKMMALLQAQSSASRSAVESRRCQDSVWLHPGGAHEAQKLCLLVQNLPFDVRKMEVMDFFLGFNVHERDVILLQDSRGGGAGRALVLFQSEEEASRAMCLNGQRFLGSQVMLRCISCAQMREFGVKPPLGGSVGKQGERGGSWVEHPGYPDVWRPHGRPTGAPVLTRPDGDNGRARRGAPAEPRYEGPTCVKLLNLPLQITMEEIYDFCHGFRLIPGSVSLQPSQDGEPRSSATVVFQSRLEALTAITEISGRAIGPRRVQLEFV